MIHIYELDVIHWMHQFRNSFFDQFFKFFDFFDRQEFFFILIPIIWLGFGWKTGLKLFYILLLSNLVNHGLKEFILRGLVGVLGTFACYFLTLLFPTTNSALYLFPRFLLLGLWVSLGSHLVCRKLFANNKALEVS